jgi:hypothetical protein
MKDPPVVIQTHYPADLDPLDILPRHLSLTLLDPNAKPPSMVNERSVWVSVVGIGGGRVRFSSGDLLSNEP